MRGPEVRPARHRELRCSGESGGGRMSGVKREGPEVGNRRSAVEMAERIRMRRNRLKVEAQRLKGLDL